MSGQLRKKLSGFSIFSGSALMMAFSLLSVIVLLFWWHQLLSRNLETQYRFFKSQVISVEGITPEVIAFIREQDERLANEIFPGQSEPLQPRQMAARIDSRLENRKKMVLYEQIFFVLLLLSGHIFFLYIYFRERSMRKQTEETVLLAAHELRQPLQSLSLALETVGPTARGKAAIAIKTGAAEIDKLSQQVKWLTQTFSENKTSNARTNIDDVGKFLLKLAHSEFQKSDLNRLDVIAPDQPIAIRISTAYLVFLLRNLTENALKYATGEVRLEAKVKRASTVFEVTNSQTSLSQGEFRKIGMPFFRSTDKKVQNTSGFGVGLYLCGRVARRAGGSLHIAHHDGQTTATLKLKNA